MAIGSNQPAVIEGTAITGGGVASRLNISAATLVQAGKGRVVKVSVLVAGAAGSVNDAATTGAAASANQIFVIPATVGVYTLDFPVTNGIVVTPGAAQVVAVSYA